jgi:hypothetical protein
MNTDFQNLLNRFKDFPVIERKPSFLDIAGFPSRETVWRNIFAFFFNPTECHGFKDLFLRSFFDALGKREQSTGDFDSMTVRTECQTTKGNFLDLLIACDEFAIGIEMKVNAELYNDLADYGELVKAQNPVDEHKVVLSVSPCGVHSNFSNLLYADFITAIKGQLGNYMLAADPQYTSFLLDFLNHVTRFIGGYVMDIDPKQLQFLKDNNETIGRLIKTHARVRNALERRMEKIHDDVMVLDSLKGKIINHWRLFTYNGHRLTKFHISAGAVRFYYQLSVTHDYCNGTRFWIDDRDQSRYKKLDQEFAATFDREKLKFDLALSQDEVVSTIEKMLLSMIAFLAEKQAAQTPL